MSATIGRNVAFATSIAISAFLLWYFFSGIDWDAFFLQLHRVRLEFLLLLLLLFAATFYVRGLRWRYLLPSSDQLSTLRLTEATFVGLMATTLLPLRAGEFIRPWVAARWQPVSFAAAFASLVVERVLDIITLLFFLFLSLGHIQSAPDWLIVAAKVLAVAAGTLLLVLVLAYIMPKRLVSWSNLILSHTVGRFHKGLELTLQKILDEVLLGLRGISSFREACLVVFYSLALWGLMAITYQSMLWCFGEFPSLWVGLVLSTMVAFAVAAPSAPSFIGTFQAGCVAALSGVFGYPKEFSLALSVVAHIFTSLLIVLCGACILHRRGLGFSELIHSKDSSTSTLN